MKLLITLFVLGIVFGVCITNLYLEITPKQFINKDIDKAYYEKLRFIEDKNLENINLTEKFGYYSGLLIVAETGGRHYQDIFETLIHEYTHHLDYNYIDDKGKVEWEKIHDTGGHLYRKDIEPSEELAVSMQKVAKICYDEDELLSDEKRDYFKKYLSDYIPICD